MRNRAAEFGREIPHLSDRSSMFLVVGGRHYRTLATLECIGVAPAPLVHGWSAVIKRRARQVLGWNEQVDCRTLGSFREGRSNCLNTNEGWVRWI